MCLSIQEQTCLALLLTCFELVAGLLLGQYGQFRDDSAHVFTKGFYDGLTSTHDPAEAFCLAIRHLKSYLTTPPENPSSSNEQTARTVDWAGFMPFMSV
jgi:hypothetical protein